MASVDQHGSLASWGQLLCSACSCEVGSAIGPSLPAVATALLAFRVPSHRLVRSSG